MRAPRHPLRLLLVAALILGLVVGTGLNYRLLGERLFVGAANVAVSMRPTPVLVVPPLPGVTHMVTSNGLLLATFTASDQVPRRLDQIAPIMRAALIASEDRTFFTNDGVDSRGIVRAALNDLLGHPTQGGSTITQQYVKNLLISEYGVAYADASSLTRKIREVAYAANLSRLFTKDQILTGYLNTVYFGEGATGVGAAAERYFSIPAGDLNATQSALLVALLRSPTAYDPLVYPADALAERNVVLTTMVADHTLSLATATLDSTAPLGLKMSTLPQGCLSSVNPTFCDWVSSQLLSLPQLGSSLTQRLARLAAGDLTIVTSLVPSLQADAQTAVTSKVGFTSPIGSAMVMIRPGTGAVEAMATNRKYGLDVKANQTTLNYALHAAPVGSTMKIFTLGAALSAGIPLTTVLPAGATYHSTIFVNPPGGYFTNAEPYDPTYIDLATATAFSVNTAFVQLEEKVGVLAIARVARAMGLPVPSAGPLAPTSREGSFTLGARAFTPLEMAGAYATLAAHGLYCTPTGITALIIGTHRVVVSPQCHQALSASVADAITAVLAGVVKYGTGVAAAVVGHPLVGKTGTTSNFGAAWFDGYTPTLATATWVGNPLGPTHPLLNVDGVAQVFGGTLPAEEFSLAMTPALASSSPWSIPAATESYLLTSHLIVPNLAGLSVVDAIQRLRALGLVATGPALGTVVSSSPSPGTALDPGSTVHLSAGSW